MNINAVALTGNLTADPQLRQTPNGTPVASLRVASNKRRKRNEQWVDVPVYVDVEVFGGQATACAQHLRKGSSVGIKGELEFAEWTDKTSQQKRTKLYVTADVVEFTGPRPAGQTPTAHAAQPQPAYSQPPQPVPAQPEPARYRQQQPVGAAPVGVAERQPAQPQPGYAAHAQGQQPVAPPQARPYAQQPQYAGPPVPVHAQQYAAPQLPAGAMAAAAPQAPGAGLNGAGVATGDDIPF